ncbi:MAG: aldo/keto reductase [Gemmatimonadetes bacterium]|nr:aldo/keto reductase [Gemmatimonadota bacterium]
MRHTNFPVTNRPVPVIGLGSWNLERPDRPRAVRVVRAALDAGLTHVDTAEMYGSGRVEDVLGEALAGRRDEVFLVSKVLPGNASRRGTIDACERSLKRLRTDRLDCYLLHWEGPHPLADTFAAFEELVAAGKILSFGVSNFDVERLEEAVRVAGPGRVACNQVLYHLESRGIEHALLPACRRHGVALVGYSPFAQGAPETPETPGGAVLAEIAARHDVTIAAVTLAFLVREPGTFTIPMTSRGSHARENAAAGDVVLSAEDVARIDRAFPRGARRESLDTL